MAGKLIVLVGVDGAGKTTLTETVAERLSPLGVRGLSHRTIGDDAPAYVERAMRAVARLLWPEEDTTFDHLLPPEFYVHLKATWYSLFCECVAAPVRSDGYTLLVDGWVYKFIAKMTLDDYPEARLREVFSHVPEPDLVLLVDTDVEAIWNRRSDFKPHELGLHDGFSELGRKSFLEYQGRLRNKLLEMAERDGWEVVPVPGTLSVGEAADRLQERILAWRGRTTLGRAVKPDRDDSGRSVTMEGEPC
jgi:dTMP kinase